MLYDDGKYSAIWGEFEENDEQVRYRLGTRWNGNPNDAGDVGYPSHSTHPLWYVQPEILVQAILKELQARVSALPPSAKRARQLNAIAAALAAP